MRILSNVLEGIKVHAEEAYPEECCGLLIGTPDEKLVSEAMRMKNSHSGARNSRYSIDPLEILRADQAAARRSLAVIGIYHSHPDYAARLSEFDLEHSFPWYSYLVLSVPRGKVGVIKAWVTDAGGGRPAEEVMEITEAK